MTGKWRKGTKKDALASVVALLVFAAIFLSGGVSFIVYVNLAFGILFASIGAFILYKSFEFLFKYVIGDTPYEYYVHVKFIPSHYKGSQIDLPNSFIDLTPHQNACLERNEFPYHDDHYLAHTQINYLNEDLYFNRNNETSKKQENKNGSSDYDEEDPFAKFDNM